MGSAGAARGEKPAADDLFRRIGMFLADHRLSPEPGHYAFAYLVLTDGAGPIAQAVARITDGGIRLSRNDIERLGGVASSDAPIEPAGAGPSLASAAAPADATFGLVARVQLQVESFMAVMRSMQDETRGFGRDLQASADAIRDSGEMLGLDGIIGLTATMIERVHASERRLHAATQEADALRAQLQEAQGSARRDPLTGLANRRALAEAFAALESGGHACLAVCDIDWFKQVNDGFGHAVGDRVLTAIGQMLASACAGHLTARHGGEEFAVLFTGIGPDAAHAMLEAARRSVAARRFRDRESHAPLGAVTFSAGLGAVLPGETLDTAFRRIDRALYRAKAAGRNQLMLAEPPMVGG